MRAEIAARRERVRTTAIRVWMLLAAAGLATAGLTNGARAQAGVGGTIVGVVTTHEPAPKPLRVALDRNVCGDAIADESIVVNATGHVAGAVVTIAGVRSAAPASVQIENRKCAFAPHVSTLRPRGDVKLVSRDPLIHTTHAANASGKAFFNISLPIQDVVMSRAIDDRPGVVTLTCGTHTWMRGYIVVTDELAAVSGADGSFRLEGVPAGPREVRIWHETLKAAPVSVTVKDGETVTVNVVLVK